MQLSHENITWQLSFILSALVTGIFLKFLQFKAIFIKRFLCALRDKKSVITQFILPIVFVILGIVLLKTSSDPTDDRARLLNLKNISEYAPSGSAKVFYADLTGSEHFEVGSQSHVYCLLLSIIGHGTCSTTSA